MGKNVIQINGGIALNVDVRVKRVMHVKKTLLFGSESMIPFTTELDIL